MSTQAIGAERVSRLVLVLVALALTVAATVLAVQASSIWSTPTPVTDERIVTVPADQFDYKGPRGGYVYHPNRTDSYGNSVGGPHAIRADDFRK